MERIILRHLKGSKASQVEEFPLEQFAELTFGRDPASSVKFEPEKDDLVGRQHARLTRDTSDSSKFVLMDLNSRNGTFLNKSRVVGSIAISPGDVIQLGAGGPEIEFDVDPRPEGQVKATRLAFAAAPADATREATASAATAGAAASGVGKATVERMIGQTKKEGRRNMLLVGAAAVVVLAIGITWVRNDTTATSQEIASGALAQAQNAADSARAIAVAATRELESRNAMTPAQIAEQNSPSVVLIEVAWKLIDKESGQQVYRRYVRNRYKGQDGRDYVYIDNGKQWVPTYIQVANGVVEPDLTLNADEGMAVGGIGHGSGFVVTEDGFLVTNRHIGAPWRESYQQLDPQGDAGPLVDGNGRIQMDNQGTPVIVPAPYNWVPSESKQYGPKGLNERYEGRLDELQVAFPNNTLRIPAQLARVSDRHDVALLKISSPQMLPKVAMSEAEQIVLGDPVVVMGYPGLSGFKVERIGQKLGGLKDMVVRDVPEPTLTVGNVGKILREADPTTQFSVFGDHYQLSMSVGGGNSGGPVFDGNGQVVAIISSGSSERSFGVTFAVPVKYAQELMRVTGSR